MNCRTRFYIFYAFSTALPDTDKACFLESFQDFLIELDMKPRMHYEQPPRKYQNSNFQIIFQCEKLNESLQKKNFLSALFIILVSLTVTLFSEKMFISTRCIRGFTSNSIKKS